MNRNIFKNFKDYFHDGVEEALAGYKHIDIDETIKSYWGEIGEYHIFNDYMKISMIVCDDSKLNKFKNDFNLQDDDYILVMHASTDNQGIVIEPKDHEILFRHLVR